MQMNQLGVVNHPAQGTYLKALFLCSAGILRSATASYVFSREPYNWNTRNAGCTKSYALINVDDRLLEWADRIFFMEMDNYAELSLDHPEYMEWYKHKMHILSIPDDYPYREEELVRALTKQVDAVMLQVSQTPQEVV